MAMSYLQALILGLVQGLTEFIPVSSSGHLVLVHSIFGAGGQDLAVDATLQLATVLAVLVFFWKDLWRIFFDFFKILGKKEVEENHRSMVWAIIVGTIPAVIFGLLLQSKMETIFRSDRLVALALIFGSLLMYFAEKWPKGDSQVTVKKGLFVGLYQCLALIPGVSRSGSTISGGLFNGLNRENATRFSFLLSFPIIFGSGMKELIHLAGQGLLFSLPMALSFVVAFVTGLWAIGFLLRYLKNHTLNVFVWYRVLLAILILILI